MTRLASYPVLMSALFLASASAAQPTSAAQAGEEGRASSLEAPAREEVDRLGAVLVPVTLPDGTTALYGYAGAPEIGVGFRQGISGFELEARARLNWFQLSTALELAARFKVLERGALTLAPTLALGVVLNSGATYMDDDNFSGVLLRLSPGLIAGLRLAETVSLVGLVDLPLDIGLTKSDSRRFQALGGGGVEVYLGNDVSVLLAGQLGVETFRERAGFSDTRLGWSLKAGLGARLF